MAVVYYQMILKSHSFRGMPFEVEFFLPKEFIPTCTSHWSRSCEKDGGKVAGRIENQHLNIGPVSKS